MFIQNDGIVSGTLSFPAEPGLEEKSLMDLSGQVTSWTPMRLRFTGRGRPNTEIFDYVYDYEGEVAPAMPGAIDQRLAILGSVVRSQDHGSGDQVAKAGVAASFVAVKRPFAEPRDVSGAQLAGPALDMLAGRVHRLHHTVWHTVRGSWWDPLSPEDRAAVAKLNWPLDRPPFTEQGALDLENGAGEDFLFMHRRMIAMVRDAYRDTRFDAPRGWTTLPPADAAQFAYVEKPDPERPGESIHTYDPAASGFMVPPATAEYLSAFPEDQRPGLAFLKTPQFFRMVMRPHERMFRSPRYLASLSLGALGNLLEFTIHNQMHMRWASAPRDPATGAVGGRPDFDLAAKWNDPRNDYLGDFYSSHVNPIFWKLHGWIDDRIEDWFRAHEAARPGAVGRRTHKGVDWFEKGEWVATDKPFDQPDWWDQGHEDGHGHHHGGDDQKVEEMLAVLDVIRRAVERPRIAVAAPREARRAERRLTSFATWLSFS
ncbi:hypothetical protein GGE65_007406 [Skermanella aerolata]|uniref:hypothetical protein n=1 Tax=Skermanella aerolata TaxID=393310 RepID=UPI003D1D20A7